LPEIPSGYYFPYELERNERWGHPSEYIGAKEVEGKRKTLKVDRDASIRIKASK
jgi:hypothetical protein